VQKKTTGKARERKRKKGGEGKGKEKKRLVGLIAVIVDGSIAHPADLAKFLTLFSSENFKCGSIWIDKRVVSVPVVGLLGVGVKRGAIRECLEDGLHCDDYRQQAEIIVKHGVMVHTERGELNRLGTHERRSLGVLC